MRGPVPGSIVALFLMSFLLCAVSSSPVLAGDYPEVEKVLSLYAKAYSDRDVAAYGRLLGPEFTAGNGQSEWDRDAELKNAGNLFQAAEAVELTFSDKYDVTETKKGVWEVTGLLPTLRVLDEGKWFTVSPNPELPASMTVVRTEEGEIRITRWFMPSE